MNIPWKKHPTDGELRAYTDRETGQAASNKIARHLETCNACRARINLLSTRSAQIGSLFQGLIPPETPVLPTRTARARLDRLIHQKENTSMFQKMFARKYWTAWTSAGLIVLLAVGLAIPSVRAAAINFLGLFRVEQVTVVEVNPGDLPTQLGESTNMKALFDENVSIEENGDSYEVATQDEASAAAGFGVRLPQEIDGEQTLTVIPGGKLTLKVDVDKLNAILKDIGREDIEIPQELDGENVVVNIPTAVAAAYGSCEMDVETAREHGFDPDNPESWSMGECTSLVQMPSPTIEAKPGLDLTKIGEAYLEFMGMDRAQAEQFAQSVDWTTTLVIPVPRSEAQFSKLTVDGVEGTLITDDNPYNNHYLLIWVKNGILYALTGEGVEVSAQRIGDTLQ